MRWSFLLSAFAPLLAGCDAPASAPPPDRPVLSTVVSESDDGRRALVGVINARVQSDFSFQVLGRLISRPVNVGDSVKKGEMLAVIDSVKLKLAMLSSSAGKATTEAQLANAIGVAERQAELAKTNATTQAQVDAAEQALATARAAQANAAAAVTKAKVALDYAVLTADFDGVVTNTNAEVGQTVSPSQVVVTVADPSERDVVIDAPEAAAPEFPLGARVEVFAQIDSRFRAEGTVREISPELDAITRTRRIKIGLDHPSPAFRLGSTVTARLLGRIIDFIQLPATAILFKNGEPFVWIVDPHSKKVSTRQVSLALPNADPVHVTGGLQPGMRVVTAGVHRLVEGQTVRLQPRAAS